MCSADILALGLPQLSVVDWSAGIVLSTGTYGDRRADAVLTGARSVSWQQ